MGWRILIVFLLSILLILQIVGSQSIVDIDEKIDDLDESVDNFEDSLDDIGNLKEDYLSQEWGEIFNGTFMGSFFEETDKLFTFSSPLFLFVLGIEFSWSWLFFITLFLFIFLTILLYWMSSIIGLTLNNRYSNHLKFSFFIVILLYINAIRLPLFTSKSIITVIKLFGNPWFQFLIAFLMIVAIAMLSYYFKEIKQWLKNKAKESDKIDLDYIESLHKMQDINDAFSKGMINKTQREELLRKAKNKRS
jgi:hypothetical protein